MMTRYRALLIWIAAFPSAALAQETAPRNGTEVLERMYAAYTGKWYHTLTFAQKTTQYRPNGAKRIQAWREALRHTAKGTQLRIDVGDPSLGNGTLYTADSAWQFQGGTLKSSSADGNVFLPLIEGVYVQPVARTVAELASAKIDLSRLSAGMWSGAPVWVVGASSVADTTSPQIWVDVQTKVVVRVIVSVGGPDPLDIHLDDYVQAGGGMLATKISMFAKGKPIQIEDYADWKVDVPLSDGLFDVAHWLPR